MTPADAASDLVRAGLAKTAVSGMAYREHDAASVVPDVPRIQEPLEAIAFGIERTRDALVKLEQRLNPILELPSPALAEERDRANHGIPLVDDLRLRAEDVHELAAHVENLLRRLAL